MFASYGEITDAVVIMDRMSGRSKGFGFVTFADEAAAEKAAAEMNEKDMNGRKIVVNVARPKVERPRGDFGGGDRRSF
jgi:RNA recognition motif-containing protein